MAAEASSASSAVHGYCALCTAHCATIATVENGRVTRLDADPDHPNGGVICIKGKAAPDLVYHPDRLDYPLRRTRPKGDADPGWQRISWDEALDAIAKRLLDIRERYGSEAVAFVHGTPSGTSIDDSVRWLRRFCNAFGSPNVASPTHVCNWHKDTVFGYTFGKNYARLPLPDFARSNAFLLWGSNPSSTNLIMAHDIVAARSRGMKIVAVDPRRVGIAGQADFLLQVRPGSDGALALALIHVLIEQQQYDEAFVCDWTNGPFLIRNDAGRLLTEADLVSGGKSDRYIVWDENRDGPVVYDSASGGYGKDNVKAALFGDKDIRIKDGTHLHCTPAFATLADIARRHTPEQSAAITWVPAEKVREAAQLLATNRPVSIYMWNGVAQHTNATQTNRAISSLYALLGDVDRPGGNVDFSFVGLKPVQGEEFLTKEQAAKRIGLEKKPIGPPAKPGDCAPEDYYTAVLEGQPYPIKALLDFGSNPIIGFADSSRGRAALCALDFAVACDFFMTPTAELCDYVLPAASFLETANVTPGARYRAEARTQLQYRPAAIEPLAERRSDTQIVFDLARRVGLGDRFWQGDVEKGYAYELGPTGISLDQLKSSPGGITLSVPHRFQKHEATTENGIKRGFATPTRRVELYSTLFAEHGYSPLPDYVEPAVSPISREDLAAEYPLIFTNAKFTTFIHSQQRGLARLRKVSPDPTAELNPETAARFSIKDKVWMVIQSPKGSIRARARVTDRILPGVVCCQPGWWQECKELELPGYDAYSSDGANVSALIGGESVDPISGATPNRSLLCRIRPVESEVSGYVEQRG